MGQQSLAVSEVSKSSPMMGKSSSSAKQGSESEGFIDALKSAFSGKETSSSESAEAVEGAEKATPADGAEKVAETEAEVAAEEGSEESTKALLEQSDGEIAGDGKALPSDKTAQVAADGKTQADQAMDESSELLGRLDKANQTLKPESPESAMAQGQLTDAEKAAAGVATAGVATAAAKEMHAAGDKTDGSTASEESPAGQGVKDSPGGKESPGSKESIEWAAAGSGAVAGAAVVAAPGSGKAMKSAELKPEAPVNAQAGKPVSEAGVVDESAIPDEAALAAAGTGAALAAAGTEAELSDQQVAKNTRSQAIEWKSEQVPAGDAQTELATRFQDVNAQQADIDGNIVAAGAGAGVAVAASGQLEQSQPDPDALSEHDYVEPMWSSVGAQNQPVTEQLAAGAKDPVVAKSAAALAGAGMMAQLNNPVSASMPADKAALSGAEQAVASGTNTSFAASQAAANSLAAAGAPAAMLNPEASAASAKAVHGAAAGAAAVAALAGGRDKPSHEPGGEKAEFAHQIAAAAGQQGTAQLRAEGPQAQAASQPPLTLNREMAGEQLAERVQMMMSKNLKNVDIRLDPPELGRLHIRMTMHNDTASVQFTVANQQTRDMVEQAMPRLREMLAQQGLQLADTSVQQQNAGQQQQSQYLAGQEGSGKGQSGIFDADDGLNADEVTEVNVDVASKRDGISFYA